MSCEEIYESNLPCSNRASQIWWHSVWIFRVLVGILEFFSLKIKIFEIGKRVEIYFRSYGSCYSIGFDEWIMIISFPYGEVFCLLITYLIVFSQSFSFFFFFKALISFCISFFIYCQIKSGSFSLSLFF